MKRALAALAATAMLLWPSRAADIAAAPAMWVVHGPAATAYLLGSMHRLPKGVHWMTPEILAAMKRADTFVFEAAMDANGREKAAATMQDNGVFPASMSLPSYFDDRTREDFRRVIMRTHADPTPVVHMRPWLAALYLQGAADGPANVQSVEGVDFQLYAWARQHRIRKFAWFETYDQQLNAVKGGQTMQDEMALFRLMLKSILASEPHPKGSLFAAWANGDTKALASLGPDDPNTPAELKKPLLEDRNRRWIPQIETMLAQPHTFFITVGAAHLVGKYGVPNLLRAKGYRVDDPGVTLRGHPPALRLSTAS